MQFQLELKNQLQHLPSKGYFPCLGWDLCNVQIHEKEKQNRKLAPAGADSVVV